MSSRLDSGGAPLDVYGILRDPLLAAIDRSAADVKRAVIRTIVITAVVQVVALYALVFALLAIVHCGR